MTGRTVTQIPITRYYCIATLFALVYACGVWGYMLNGQGPADAMYNSLRLIGLEAVFYLGDVTLNWQLQLARFALPLFTLTAIIGLLLQVAGQQIVYLRLALHPMSTVFLGARGTVPTLLKNFAPRHRALVLYPPSDVGHGSVTTTHKNVLYLCGDPLDTELLRSTCVARAQQVFIMSDDDPGNLDTAKQVIAVVPLNTNNAPRLIVAIDDMALLRIATQDPAFKSYRNNTGGDIIWFSPQAQAARLLLLQHPPLGVASLTKAEPLHIAVFGFSPFTRQLILQVLRHCIYLNDRPLHLSIFAPNEADFIQFLQMHPLLSDKSSDSAYGAVRPNVNIQFYCHQLQSPDPARLRQAIAHSGSPPDQVYVTGLTDYDCLHIAYRVKQTLAALELNPAITTCLPGTDFSDRQEAQVLATENLEIYQGIEIFHCVSSLFDADEAYPGRVADEVGLMIHTAYKVLHTEPKLTVDQPDFKQQFSERLEQFRPEAETEWLRRLDNDFRWSSRHSGDHLFVKLNELGFVLQTRNNPTVEDNDLEQISALEQAIDQHINVLNRLEHRRFCCERLIDNWLFRIPSNKPLQLNETLVPFDHLNAHEQSKDEVVIRVIPMILRSKSMRRHYRLVRREQTN